MDLRSNQSETTRDLVKVFSIACFAIATGLLLWAAVIGPKKQVGQTDRTFDQEIIISRT